MEFLQVAVLMLIAATVSTTASPEIPIIHLLSPMEPAELPVLELVNHLALNEQPIIAPPAIKTPDLGPPGIPMGETYIISPTSAPPILEEGLPLAELAKPDMANFIPHINSDTTLFSPESLELNGLPTPENQNSGPDLIPFVSMTTITHENEDVLSLTTTSPTLNIPLQEGLVISNKPSFPVLRTSNFEVTPKQAGPPTIPILMMPIMPYKFSYSVTSASSAVFTSHDQEKTPTGPLVGQYSYLRPDGIYMTVRYTADENGYRATVEESRTPPPSLVALPNTPVPPQAPPTVPQSPPSPATPLPPTTPQQPGTPSTDAPQPQFPNFPNVIISKPPEISIIPEPSQPAIPFPLDPPPYNYPVPPNTVAPVTQPPATTPSQTTLATDLPPPQLPSFPPIFSPQPTQPPSPPIVNPPLPGFPNFPNVIITEPPVIEILTPDITLNPPVTQPPATTPSQTTLVTDLPPPQLPSFPPIFSPQPTQPPSPPIVNPPLPGLPNFPNVIITEPPVIEILTPDITQNPPVSVKPQPNQPDIAPPPVTPPPQSYLPPVPDTPRPQPPEVPNLITPQPPNPPPGSPLPEIPPPFAFVKPKPEISEIPETQVPDFPSFPLQPSQPQQPQSPPSIAFPPPHFPSFPNFIQPNPQLPQNPPTPPTPQIPPFTNIPQPNPLYPGGPPPTQVYLPPSF